MIMQQLSPHTVPSSSYLADASCEEGLSFEDIPYDPKLIAAIEEAQAEIARGEFIPHEELEKEFYSWCSE